MNRRFFFLFAGSLGITSFTLAHDANAQSEPPPQRWSEPSSQAQSTGEPSKPTPSTSVATDSHWYGWQTILVDGAALATMTLGSSTRSDPLFGVGVGVYALGPPMVHAAHGRADATFGDIGIRLAAPVIMGMIGYAIDYSTSSPCPTGPNAGLGGLFCFRGLGGAALGVLAGYGTAVILDAVWLAREPVVRKPDGRDALRVHWTPTVAVTPTGGSAGVSGMF